MFFRDKKNKKTVNEGINIVRTTPGARLVDIRSKSDFDKGHVSGAVNIPYDRLDLAVHRLPDKDALLYLYGTYYHKPKKLLGKFRKLGYTDVHSCGFYEEHNVTPLS